MSKRLDSVLGFCSQHRYTFPFIAKLGQGCLQAARASRIPDVWHRVPITMVTIAIVTTFWIYDYVSVSAADSAPPKSTYTIAYVPPLPFKPSPPSPLSIGRTKPAPKHSKASHSAFRRVPVGENEVDYVAQDVTIRLFTPGAEPARIQHRGRQRHGKNNVATRHFRRRPALASKARPDSTAAQVVEPSALVSK
jgi:hypothetical protein